MSNSDINLIELIDVVVNEENTEITIDPINSMSDRQWQDITISLIREVEGITITDDPEILHDDPGCPGPNIIDDKIILGEYFFFLLLIKINMAYTIKI